MTEYKITLIPEEEKALLTVMISIQEWVENAIKNRARQAIDKIVEYSGKGSKFTPVEDKIGIIASLIAEKNPLLESASERQEKMKNEFKKTG
jgi:hypothetical protein